MKLFARKPELLETSTVSSSLSSAAASKPKLLPAGATVRLVNIYTRLGDTGTLVTDAPEGVYGTWTLKVGNSFFRSEGRLIAE